MAVWLHRRIATYEYSKDNVAHVALRSCHDGARRRRGETSLCLEWIQIDRLMERMMGDGSRRRSLDLGIRGTDWALWSVERGPRDADTSCWMAPRNVAGRGDLLNWHSRPICALAAMTSTNRRRRESSLPTTGQREKKAVRKKKARGEARGIGGSKGAGVICAC
jgi:hypothetical protein